MNPERKAQDAAARWLNRYVEFCGELAAEAVGLQASGASVALVVIPIPGMTRSRAVVLPVTDVPAAARRVDSALPRMATGSLRDYIASKLQTERLQIEES